MFYKRLKSLQNPIAGEVILTEAQLIAMEHFGSQDTYYVVAIKVVDQIPCQSLLTFIPALPFPNRMIPGMPSPQSIFSMTGFFHSSNNNRVLLLCILTAEFKGKLENYKYEFYMLTKVIDHIKSQVRYPQSNGICRRLHRTIEEEFYAIAFRK